MPSSIEAPIEAIAPTRFIVREVKPPAVGAVVIGGEHPGLGIARSLGRRGIPVYVVDDQHSVSGFSRYVERVIQAKDLLDERKTVHSILEIGHRYGLKGWVLFPTRDETVAAFSRYRSELESFFRVTTPEWDVVRWALDKRNAHTLALQLDIPTPQTWCNLKIGDLLNLREKLPLAVKPAIKENFFYSTGAKAWRADSVEQLQRLFEKASRLIDPEEIMLQEIVPGDGRQQFSYCAFFRNGCAHSSMVARRGRQHPREFGRAATYVESVDLPIVEELSERLLRAIDYYGLVEIEFKLDPRDGLYKLLDINARVWGFHSLGAPAGVDFPYLLFADQIGESTKRCRGKAGVGWLRMITDVPTVLSEILRGQLDFSSYMRSLRHMQVESVFSSEDPFPSLLELILLPYAIGKKYLV
jgi:predicted ATP-grasp superfamily ATP-dependent carboligase